MRKPTTCTSVLVLFALVSILFRPVHSQNLVFGVTPPRIYADNLRQNVTFEREVLLTKDYDQDLAVRTRVTGNASHWITLPQGTLAFPANRSRLSLKVAIRPDNSPLGYYEAQITLRISDHENRELDYPVKVFINLTDKNISVLKVKGAKVFSGNAGEILLRLDIENSGNVRASYPSFNVQLLDKYRTEVIRTYNITETETIDPFTRKTISIDLRHNLTSGQYFARVGIEGIDDVPFDVSENSLTGDFAAIPRGSSLPILPLASLLAIAALIYWRLEK